MWATAQHVLWSVGRHSSPRRPEAAPLLQKPPPLPGGHTRTEGLRSCAISSYLAFLRSRQQILGSMGDKKFLLQVHSTQNKMPGLGLTTRWAWSRADRAKQGTGRTRVLKCELLGMSRK